MGLIHSTYVESSCPQHFDNVNITFDEKTHPDLVSICQMILKASCSIWYALYFQKNNVETLLTNYQPEWMHHYYTQEYDKIDYARDTEKIFIFPKTWGHKSLPELSQEQKKLFLEASDYAINEGISFPLFYGQNRFGIFTLSRSKSPFLINNLNLDYGLLSQGFSQLIHESDLTRKQIIHDQVVTYIQNAMHNTYIAKRKQTRAKCYLTLVSDIVNEHPELLESHYFIQKTLELFADDQ